jgi:hypothetical protein
MIFDGYPASRSRPDKCGMTEEQYTPDINHHRTTQHNLNSITWSVSAFIVFYSVLWRITVYQIPILCHKFYTNFNDRREQQVLILESAASSASSTVQVGLMMAMT